MDLHEAGQTVLVRTLTHVADECTAAACIELHILRDVVGKLAAVDQSTQLHRIGDAGAEAWLAVIGPRCGAGAEEWFASIIGPRGCAGAGARSNAVRWFHRPHKHIVDGPRRHHQRGPQVPDTRSALRTLQRRRMIAPHAKGQRACKAELRSTAS